MAWTAPATATVGQVLTAAWMNTYVRDNLNHVYGSIATFSPTLTQSGAVTLTTAVGRYRHVGHTCYLHCFLNPSGTGTGGNAIVVGAIPAAIAPRVSGAPYGGDAEVDFGIFGYHDSGTAFYGGACWFATSSTLQMSQINSATAVLGVTPNFAVAAADSMNLTITYETASPST